MLVCLLLPYVQSVTRSDHPRLDFYFGLAHPTNFNLLLHQHHLIYTISMPSKPKTTRREHPLETINGIWALACVGYSPSKIYKTFPLPIPTIKSILKRLRKCKDEL